MVDWTGCDRPFTTKVAPKISTDNFQTSSLTPIWSSWARMQMNSRRTGKLPTSLDPFQRIQITVRRLRELRILVAKNCCRWRSMKSFCSTICPFSPLSPQEGLTSSRSLILMARETRTLLKRRKRWKTSLLRKCSQLNKGWSNSKQSWRSLTKRSFCLQTLGSLSFTSQSRKRVCSKCQVCHQLQIVISSMTQSTRRPTKSSYTLKPSTLSEALLSLTMYRQCANSSDSRK